MKDLIKNTPVGYTQRTLNAKMGAINGMEVAFEFAGTNIESGIKKVLGVTDVSCFNRFGIKGPQAAKWLQSHKFKTPAEINTWVEGKGCLVMRLGGSEFLLEDQYGASNMEKMASFDQAKVAGAYQVARADAAFLLSGSEVLNMLSELCMLDLCEGALPKDGLVMTQVAGISATLIRQNLNNASVFRLWCDGTYGAYMWDMMLEIAKELGGGAVGFTSHFK